MLTYEALANEAKDRGMPGTKMRGVLREYLQILILKELYRQEEGKKFCFTGGTYLRLLHGTKRFSEDLDFNAKNLSKAAFEKTLEKIKGSLKQEGIAARLEFGHWENLWVADIVFPNVEHIYGIESKYSKKEGLLIKLEVYRPRWAIKPEVLMAGGFGCMSPVVCTQKGALFADKIDALVKKNRARHLFDILFMLSKKYPIDTSVLKTLGIRGRPLEIIVHRVESFSDKELKSQAESLRPFLFDEKEADLLLSAKTVVRQLVEQYQN